MSERVCVVEKVVAVSTTGVRGSILPPPTLPHPPNSTTLTGSIYTHTKGRPVPPPPPPPPPVTKAPTLRFSRTLCLCYACLPYILSTDSMDILGNFPFLLSSLSSLLYFSHIFPSYKSNRNVLLLSSVRYSPLPLCPLPHPATATTCPFTNMQMSSMLMRCGSRDGFVNGGGRKWESVAGVRHGEIIKFAH